MSENPDRLGTGVLAEPGDWRERYGVREGESLFGALRRIAAERDEANAKLDAMAAHCALVTAAAEAERAAAKAKLAAEYEESALWLARWRTLIDADDLTMEEAIARVLRERDEAMAQAKTPAEAAVLMAALEHHQGFAGADLTLRALPREATCRWGHDCVCPCPEVACDSCSEWAPVEEKP